MYSKILNPSAEVFLPVILMILGSIVLGPGVCPGVAQEDSLFTKLEKDVQRIVERVSPSVVSVIADTPTKVVSGKRIPGQSFASSGIVLDLEGHIATPAEPLKVETRIWVHAYSPAGKRLQLRARVIGRDPVHNIAVVKVLFPTDKLVPVVTGDASTLRLGSLVVALGCSYQLPRSCSWGMVSGLNLQISLGKTWPTGLIMTTAPVNPGESGGALADASGKVVGMLMSTLDRSDEDWIEKDRKEQKVKKTSKKPEWMTGARNINFVLPIDRVMASVKIILTQKGDVPIPQKYVWNFLGVWGEYLLQPNAVSSQLELPVGTGFLVRSLFEGEAAMRAGIRKHDILLRIGGMDIRGSDRSVWKALQKVSLNQDVPIVLMRKGKRIVVEVRFREPPAKD